MKTVFAVLLSFCLSLALCAGPREWKDRTVYQILTDRFNDFSSSSCGNFHDYCGGTYAGITAQLDYIQDLGFDAIWISPIVVNTPGGYHGYWMKNLDKLNPHFGSEQDLKALVDECHARGIYVMLDIVNNHVGNVDMDFGQVTPFNKPEYYHSKCQITDWNNQPQVENCRLSNLPDLNQDNSFVNASLMGFATGVIRDYGFDGFRLDTVPEVDKVFWTQYQNHARTFMLGEAYNGRIDYVGGYQGPLDSLLSYPMAFTLREVFGQKHDMHKIRDTWEQYKIYFRDTSVLGTFVDNHDLSRFLNTQSDTELFKNALVFVMFWEGIPVVYYGSEQAYSGGNDPQNREPLWTSGFNRNSDMYKFVKKALGFRKTVPSIGTDTVVVAGVEENLFTFYRGKIFVALQNEGSHSATIHRNIGTNPYSPGTQVCNIFYVNDCVTVDRDGNLPVYLDHGEAKIYYPKN